MDRELSLLKYELRVTQILMGISLVALGILGSICWDMFKIIKLMKNYIDLL